MADLKLEFKRNPYYTIFKNKHHRKLEAKQREVSALKQGINERV